MYDQMFELKFIIDLLKTPVLKLDEFTLFTKSIYQMSKSRPDTMDIMRCMTRE